MKMYFLLTSDIQADKKQVLFLSETRLNEKLRSWDTCNFRITSTQE